MAEYRNAKKEGDSSNVINSIVPFKDISPKTEKDSRISVRAFEKILVDREADYRDPEMFHEPLKLP